MPSPEKASASPLEELERKLYKPGAFDVSQERPPLRHTEPTTAPGWQPPPAPPPPPPKKGLPWSTRFLIGAIAFFVLAAIAAAAIFWLGTRSISSENVELSVDAPIAIASGDTVSLLITVRNNNPTTILGTNLTVDLPDGTREATNKTEPFDHYVDTLGDIPPGGEAMRTVNAVLFGAQQEVLVIPLKVEYRTEDSNALFVVEEQYSIEVTTSPLTLTVNAPAEAASGEPFTMAVTVRSNAPTSLENVALEASYPFGFSVSQTSVPSTRGTFSLGTLTPGAERTVTITGTLSGQELDERAFGFTAGTGSGSDVALPYASADATIALARPFLATNLSLNRATTEEVVAPPGESVSGMISWINNLAVPVSDARISIAFSGNALDPTTVYTQSGFYRSSDATILFSKDTNRDLVQLAAGDRGTGAFSFSPKSAAALTGTSNPTITLTVSIAGNRVGQDRVPEQVSSTLTRTVKVGTVVAFSSRLVRNEGPFTNLGPVPPKAGTETTYTVLLSARNTVNSVGGASASMTLPSYVRFTGQVSPSAETVVYDERTRTVTWRVNDLAAGGSQDAAFQVAFTPSSSQVGRAPTMVSEQTFTGTDRFTKEQVKATAEPLPTPSQVTN